MSPIPLPAAPRMEHLKKQAKDLLAALRANDAAAHARARTHLPGNLHATPDAKVSLLHLSHAQLVIAREYGFASWPRLSRHVTQAEAAASSAATGMENGGMEDAAWETLLRAEPTFAGLSPKAAASVRAIKTAQWTETRTPWDNKDGEEIRPATQEWICVSPPAYARRQEYSDGWSHDVSDARGRFHTGASWKTYILRPHSTPFVTADVLNKVVFVPEDASADAPTSGNKREAWKREAVEQEGRTLLRWQRETIQGNFHVSEFVWTETDTPRIVRQEKRETNLLTGKLAALEICDHYLYNVEPPAGTFEMPPDKPLETRTHKDTMPEVWETFTTKEQRAAEALLARSDAAWKQGDFGAFSSDWRFQFTTDLPTEAEWKARVEQQAGLWHHWHSEVERANTQNFVPVWTASHSCTFRMVKRKVLRVRVKLQVAWPGAENTWKGTADFYLRREGRRYWIVHWECPWEEIKAAQREA